MQLKITTWNINSVRLRIDLVAKFIKAVRPDVLCLQETKCPDDAFPRKRLQRLGYDHIALNGQKGYHGVAVLSRLPFDTTKAKNYCSKTDSRHIGVVLGDKAKLRDPISIHNYYVPAGGDEPDPAINPKFEHKLAFLDEMRECPNMLPAESQGPAQGGVTHSDRVREVAGGPKSRPVDRRHTNLRTGAGKAIHVVELPCGRLGRRRSRPPARSRLGFARAGRSAFRHQGNESGPRLVAALRPCAGHGDAGGLRGYSILLTRSREYFGTAPITGAPR
jgi:hypothetical protein